MADIINLRTARKARKRDLQEQAAAENRAKFGQPKHRRTALRDEQARQQALLDGAKLERD